jgi:hypothetical protein
MAAKKSSSNARKSDRGRYTVIGGVRVKLAPPQRLLPKEERARIRQAVKDFYAEKKSD